jgi:hypothetical protein
MSAHVVDVSSITLPVRGSRLYEDGIYNEPDMSFSIREALRALACAVAMFRDERRNTA